MSDKREFELLNVVKDDSLMLNSNNNTKWKANGYEHVCMERKARNHT